jgi:alkanesulfonate monooxygenase SsuD/methylene tetrahydromethanopterin reductase-like flavin-dependent oxidoreductase (luciferase family)
VKISLFFEMQISQPTRETEARLFHACVEQAVLADSLGFHAIWAVEHHGLYEYAHSAAPETFLAFVAARTKRIRLGHGVTLTPHRYNHPIRIAERIATLDILSEGRANWGSGKSSSLTEQLAFENDVSLLDAQWLEALEMIPRMWQDEVYEHIGRFYDIPPTRIVPKPVQQPHPPIFAACSRPDSAVRVGQLGVGALNFAIGNEKLIRANVDAYRAAVKDAQPKGRAKNDWFACAPPALCLADDREACRHGMRGARFFNEALVYYYTPGKRQIGPPQISRDDLDESRLSSLMALRGDPDAPGMNVVGDPGRCAETIARYAAAGVDELILVMQLGTVPNDVVLRSIRTFGEQVLPKADTMTVKGR